MKWHDIDKPMIQFISKENTTSISPRNSFSGVGIFGSTGSGKSSTSFRNFMTAYMRTGYGGLALTVKNSDASDYLKFCAEAGRLDDVHVLKVGGTERFNFLDFQCNYGDGSGALTENIVDLLRTIISAGQNISSTVDPFWEDAMTITLSAVVDLCKLAYSKVTVELIYQISQSLPKTDDDMNFDEDGDLTIFQQAHQIAKRNVLGQIDQWESSLTADQLAILDDIDLYEEALFVDVPDARTFKMLDQFCSETLKNLTDKTRSVVDFKIQGFLYPLLRDPMYSIFCKGESTITPDMCADGKILIIDIPIKKYHKIGRDIQLIIKLLFQMAAEKREVNEFTRPLFLVCDEAQNYIIDRDLQFQLTARSARVAVIYASQSLLNYFSVMNGRNPEYQVKAFLANLTTHIYHSNNCIETNRWVSDRIGQDYFLDQNFSNTVAKDISQTSGGSYKLRNILRPEELMQLRTGSKINDLEVDAILHMQGTPINGTDNHRKITFRQLPL